MDLSATWMIMDLKENSAACETDLRQPRFCAPFAFWCPGWTPCSCAWKSPLPSWQIQCVRLVACKSNQIHFFKEDCPVSNVTQKLALLFQVLPHGLETCIGKVCHGAKVWWQSNPASWWGTWSSLSSSASSLALLLLSRSLSTNELKDSLMNICVWDECWIWNLIG